LVGEVGALWYSDRILVVVVDVDKVSIAVAGYGVRPDCYMTWIFVVHSRMIRLSDLLPYEVEANSVVVGCADLEYKAKMLELLANLEDSLSNRVAEHPMACSYLAMLQKPSN